AIHRCRGHRENNGRGREDGRERCYEIFPLSDDPPDRREPDLTTRIERNLIGCHQLPECRIVSITRLTTLPPCKALSVARIARFTRQPELEHIPRSNSAKDQALSSDSRRSCRISSLSNSYSRTFRCRNCNVNRPFCSTPRGVRRYMYAALFRLFLKLVTLIHPL